MLIVAIILIRTVFAVLSINDVRETVHSPFVTDSNTYIKPDGPLNFLYGHAYYKDSLAHKMRHFSPAIKINYTLTKSENKDEDDRFVINNNNDGINVFKGDNETSKYLKSYYKVFKEMFNVVNNEVNIHTTRKSSLFMFLTEKLDEATRFRLLAAIIMLAEGVDVPLKSGTKKIPYYGSEITIPVLTCKQDNETSFLEIEMYKIFKSSDVKKPNGSSTEEKEVFHRLKDILALVKFFIEYGGKNIKKLTAFDLAFNEMPNFLIHYYVFELIETLSDARQLFSAIKELLEYTGNGEGSKAWNLFFTKDSEEVEKYEPAYDMYQMVARLMADIGFPFSISSQPPSNVVVQGYDRKTGEEIASPNLKFSDCCDITIYSLLCCLFYNPVVKRYSLNHLEGKNYTPSGDLSAFFVSVCNKPVEKTSQYLHQQWTHVVQDLVLSEGELRGEEASESNTIMYNKKEDDVHAEIKTELLNVLKIVAKITGMPKEGMIELNKINSMVKDVEANWDDVRQNVEAFTTQLIQNITIMPVEISFEGLNLAGNGTFRGVYGTVNLKFTSMSADNVSDSHHTIKFSFNEGHASAIISDDYKIDSEVKEALNGLIVNCNTIEGSLGKRIAMYGNKFLKKDNSELVPLENVKEVEETPNELERYLAINRILMDCSLDTMDDKLYLIDLFGPYLERMTARNVNTRNQDADTSQSNGALVQNPQDSALVQNLSSTEISVNEAFSRNQLEAHDPVVQLITNIMGSVPLGDRATQDFFIQIFGFCNGEYKRLFPNFCGGSFNVLPEFTDLEKNNETAGTSFFWYLNEKRMPNTLFRLWRTFRVMYEENLLEKLSDKTDLHMFYIYAATISMATKNHDLIKAVKKDFKIRNGLMELGPDLLSRVATWFSLSISSQYREGIEILFNNWGRIRGKGNVLSALFQGKSTSCFDWYVHTSNNFLNGFCENEHSEKILMEMYCYLSFHSHHFDQAYSLLTTSPHTSALFEVLYNSLENNIKKEFDYASDILKSQYPAEYLLFEDAVRHLNALYGFIERVDNFRRGVMEKLEQSSESFIIFDKSFVAMHDQVDNMRKSLGNIRDEVNIKENFSRFFGDICRTQDFQGRLFEVIKLMEKACNKLSIPGDSGETVELDKETFGNLSLEEKLYKFSESFKRICDGLKAKGELDKLKETLRNIYSKLVDQETFGP